MNRMTLDPMIIEKNPCVREALQYEKKDDKKVQCGVCERRCIIAPGKRGFCGARANLDGQLYILTYGDISSINSNPIEKKPFYHFYPGTRALTIGSWGCNAACPWCQNWSISKHHPDPTRCKHLSPDRFVSEVKRSGCQGTSFSFNEPVTAFFEYSLDVMPKAHAAGFYNTFVSNGYMTPASLERLASAGLDAINIDIKGCQANVRKYCHLDVEKVWRNAKHALDLGIWVEITTLVIPDMNDSSQCLSSIAHRIHNDLGADVPWHLSAYFPQYQAEKYGLTKATPLATLERAHSIGREAGLHYVYLGNVQNHPYEHSYCKKCGELLIRRRGYDITFVLLNANNQCSNCNESNPFILSNKSD
ncbi:MAG: AmmeMemoRadiSam system radical SAM enzyme [Promethearchaeota archaeon]